MVLAVLIVILVLACSATQPTPDIDATIEAKIAIALTNVPTETPIPTETLVPTATPRPTPTPTPTPTPAAVFVNKWGTIGKDDGQFGKPIGVALAPDGRVYVVDEENARIQKFTSEGVFMTKWGTIGDGDGDVGGEFIFPWGIAVASDGSVYVADSGNYRIQRFSPGP